MMEGFEVTAGMLKKELKGGKPLFFVNLRHHADWDTAIFKARGALRVADDEVEQHLGEIPRDRTVVIYSVCQGDEPSIRAAELLRQNGFSDVHPLVGGLYAYLTEGLPAEVIDDREQKRKLSWL